MITLTLINMKGLLSDCVCQRRLTHLKHWIRRAFFLPSNLSKTWTTTEGVVHRHFQGTLSEVRKITAMHFPRSALSCGALGQFATEQLAQSYLRRSLAQSNLHKATCTEQLAQSNLHRATCPEPFEQSQLHRAVSFPKPTWPPKCSFRATRDLGPTSSRPPSSAAG